MTSSKWNTVIGLEVHVQLMTMTKLFSTSGNAFGATPNSQVNAFDAAYPGFLPQANLACLERALKICLALQAKVKRVTVFDRKGYFYPDLPANFQITQHYQPLGRDGKLDIAAYGETAHWIGIDDIHLEQDAGKLVHDQQSSATLVDLNRAGVPLVEIVTKPDLRSPAEAVIFLNKLKSMIVYLGVSDCNMQEGSLRVDANVSVHREGEAWGERCEIKNLNSKRFMRQAIESEIKRQRGILEGGGKIIRSTCLFDEKTGLTSVMRSKETIQDYGYFPDPDLPPVLIDDKMLDRVKGSMPELSAALTAKLVDEDKLTKEQAVVICEDRHLVDFYREARDQASQEPAFVAQWLVFGLLNVLREQNLDIDETKITAAHFVKMLGLIERGQVGKTAVKTILTTTCETGMDPEQVLVERGLEQIHDKAQIRTLAKEVLDDRSEEMETYLAGKKTLKKWFIGQVIRASGGKANPQLVEQIVEEELNEIESNN